MTIVALDRDRGEVTHRARTLSALPAWRWAVLLGTPLTLAGLELWHPRVTLNGIFGDLGPVVDWWLTLHILQLFLFALMVPAVLALLDGVHGALATTSRLAIGLFGVLYGAFDAIAGIATGILVRNARSLPADRQAGVEEAVRGLFQSMEVGGFAWMKTVAEIGWVVGILAAAIALARPTEPRTSLVLMALAALALGLLQARVNEPLGLVGALAAILAVALAPGRPDGTLAPRLLLALAAVFLTSGHPAPFGPLAFGCFALAAAWLELLRRGARADAQLAAGAVYRRY